MAATTKQFHAPYDYRDCFTINKSDTVAIAADALNIPGYKFANGLLVLTTGNVSFVTSNDLATATPVGVNMIAVPVGTIIKVDVARLNATGTTATVAALIR